MSLDGRIRRTEDKHDDLRHELSMWGFSMSPSERRHLAARIEKVGAKLEALEARRASSDVVGGDRG